MKKIYLVLPMLILVSLIKGQVAIGKESIEGSGIMDFMSGSDLGIVLPWVTESTIQEGSLIYDANLKKVMFSDGNSWQDLSINEGDVDLSDQSSHKNVGGKIVIGNPNTSAKGVIVLESEDKALILPKVESPHIKIKSPVAGTICYDTKSKMLCVYNGKEWSFWS